MGPRPLLRDGSGLDGRPAVVATIGVFDGVHRGHRALVETVIERARREGVRSLAITSGKTLKDNAFATLILPSPSVVSLTSLVLNAFPSSLKTVKVPQSLRESYESDYDWKKLLTQGVSFVSI